MKSDKDSHYKNSICNFDMTASENRFLFLLW